jgi:hypothetical protein
LNTPATSTQSRSQRSTSQASGAGEFMPVPTARTLPWARSSASAGQRAVADQAPAEPAEVGEDLVQVLSGQERLEQADRGELDVVAAAEGEREPVPG